MGRVMRKCCLKEEASEVLNEIDYKEEVREGDRVIVLRLNLHQSLNFPLLHFEARLLGKKFVHKLKNEFL